MENFREVPEKTLCLALADRMVEKLEKTLKNYTVYFVIKKNNHGYLNQETVTAENQKQAIRMVKDSVYKNSGKNAFYCTCEEPEMTKAGLVFNGGTYTRYSDVFNQLW